MIKSLDSLFPGIHAAATGHKGGSGRGGGGVDVGDTGRLAAVMRDSSGLLPGFAGIACLPYFRAPPAGGAPPGGGGGGDGGGGARWLRHSCTPNCVLRWERVPVVGAEGRGQLQGAGQRRWGEEGQERRMDGALVPVLRALTNLEGGLTH